MHARTYLPKFIHGYARPHTHRHPPSPLSPIFSYSHLGVEYLAAASAAWAVMGFTLPILTGGNLCVRALCHDAYVSGQYEDVGAWLQV